MPMELTLDADYRLNVQKLKREQRALAEVAEYEAWSASLYDQQWDREQDEIMQEEAARADAELRAERINDR